MSEYKRRIGKGRKIGTILILLSNISSSLFRNTGQNTSSKYTHICILDGLEYYHRVSNVHIKIVTINDSTSGQWI